MKKLSVFLLASVTLLVLASCEHKHTPVIDPAVEATCTEPGLTEGSHCSGCGGAIFSQKLVAPKGHTVVIDKAVSATCMSEGLTNGSHCSECGEVFVEQKVAPKTGHNIVVLDETAPTCAAEGFTEGKECIVCGEIFSGREPIAKLDHTPITLAAVAPTCSAEGLTEGQVCTVCNEVLVAQEPIARTEHVEVITPGVEPTCSLEGLTEGKHCSACNEVLGEQEPIAKIEHTEEIIAAVEPTCSLEGLTEGKRCSVCSEILVAQETIAKAEHVEVVTPALEPTCTTEGLTEGKHCSVCNEVIVAQETVAKTAHASVATDAIEPTCTEVGFTAGESCSICAATLTAGEEIPALGHVEVIDRGVAATYSTPGLTEGKHCSRCGKILVVQQVIPMLEKVNVNLPLGTITESPTILLTNDLELQIDAGVYVPGDLKETLDIVTSVMETVSGMKFEGNPTYTEAAKQYSPQSTTDLMLVEVKKNPDSESEFHDAGGWAGGAYVSSGDIINLYALIHECSHALQLRQSNWHYCQWAMEGISTYTTYKTQKYIAESYPNLAEYVDLSLQSIGDMRIWDYGKLYEHPMEYWIDNTFEYSSNTNYVIGFRLMWYLDVTFGNYTDWIYKLEESYPFYENSTGSDQLPSEKILEAFYLAYGESVFDDFYEWLKNNEAAFDNDTFTVDLRGATMFNIYPEFNALGSRYKPTVLHFYDEHGILYRDLYIGLDAGNQYLTEYKGKTYEKLTLQLSDGVRVKLFDSQGNLMRVDSGKSIDITGVSFIQLIGEGTLTKFEIVGYN